MTRTKYVCSVGEGGAPVSGPRSLPSLRSQILFVGSTPSPVNDPVQSPVPGPVRGCIPSPVTGLIKSPVPGPAMGWGVDIPARTGGTPASTGDSPQLGQGAPPARTEQGVPPPTLLVSRGGMTTSPPPSTDRRASDVTSQAVRLLRSRRRTFLLKILSQKSVPSCILQHK